jgi:hypothetical protein
MKKILRSVLILSTFIITLVLLTGCGNASPRLEDRTVIGETYTLEDNRILNGNLNVIGGVVEIKETATVNGNLFVLGGLVTIDGTIKGDLTAIGGTVNLTETAILEGDLISPVSYININQDAQILGKETSQWVFPNVGLEQFSNLPAQTYYPQTYTAISVLTQIGKYFTYTLVLVALGALLLLILPKSADRMITAIGSKPWHVLGYGALTTIVMFSVLFLSITICLIPFVLLIGLVYMTALLVGWLALGYLLGKRITNGMFNKTWHPVLTGAFGNLVLYLIALGVGQIPCVGWFPFFITMLFGLGMVVATLFGTYPFPRIPDGDTEPEQVVIFEKSALKEADISTTLEPVGIQSSPEEPFDVEEGILPEKEEDEDLTDTPVENQASLPVVPVAEVVAKPEVPIEILNLGARINIVLIDAGLTTVDDVLNRLESGEEALLEINGFGEKSLGELKQALAVAGYKIP